MEVPRKTIILALAGLLFLVAIILHSGSLKTENVPDVGFAGKPDPSVVQLYTFDNKSVKNYPHIHEVTDSTNKNINKEPFTQGLVHLDASSMIESTGLYNGSVLREFDLRTGNTIRYVKLADHYFGEGCCVVNGLLLVLTWMEQEMLVYNLTNFELLYTLSIPIEGWGLTAEYSIGPNEEMVQNETPRIWATTGGPQLLELELPVMKPDADFPLKVKIKRKVPITCFGNTISDFNEMEYLPHRKSIIGSIFQSDIMLEIDPDTGKCLSLSNMGGLYNPSNNPHKKHTDLANDVFNGVSWHPSMPRDRLLVTGKRWPFLYEVQLKQLNTVQV